MGGSGGLRIGDEGRRVESLVRAWHSADHFWDIAKIVTRMLRPYDRLLTLNSQQVNNLMGWEGFGEEIALAKVAVERSQVSKLVRGFNPFRDHFHLHRLGDRDNDRH